MPNSSTVGSYEHDAYVYTTRKHLRDAEVDEASIRSTLANYDDTTGRQLNAARRKMMVKNIHQQIRRIRTRRHADMCDEGYEQHHMEALKCVISMMKGWEEGSGSLCTLAESLDNDRHGLPSLRSAVKLHRGGPMTTDMLHKALFLELLRWDNVKMRCAFAAATNSQLSNTT